MKKFFKKVMLCICMAAAGMSVTSCDSEVIGQIIGGLINVILQGNNKTYDYSGTAYLTTYQLQQTENGTVNYDPNKGTNYTLELSPSITILNDSVCSIKLNNFTIGNARVNNFVFNTYYDNGSIDPDGPTMLTGATCVLNGVATDIGVTAFKGSITSGTESKMNLSTIHIQFEDFLIKGTFSGNNITSNQ